MTKYEQAPNQSGIEMEHRPDGELVTSVEQALELIGQPYEKAGAPEGDIRTRDDGTFYIIIAELEGPIETIKWKQEFPLSPEVFQELAQKEYIKKATPISWGITSSGIEYMREHLKGTA